MSSYWPTGDQQPDVTPAEIEFARNWRDAPKVAEIVRLKSGDGGPTRVGGAMLAGAAMRAGLVDEYTVVTHPVLIGGGTPFFSALDG